MSQTQPPHNALQAGFFAVSGASGTSGEDSSQNDPSQTGLLGKLQYADGTPRQPEAEQNEQATENRLAIARLGMATSLFYALRAKHPGAAAHGLRVALLTSGWAESMRLDPSMTGPN